jgi:FHA domain/von Willebrand factor type A domain
MSIPVPYKIFRRSSTLLVASMKTSPTRHRLNWTAGCRCLIRTAFALVLGALSSAAFAQSTLDNVVILPPSGTDTRLRADFFFPQADSVSSINVTANGKELDKTFTPAESVQNYSCAVLLLVDKTMGNGVSERNKQRLLKSVREVLEKFSSAADAYPNQFEIATIAGGNFQVLAPMGSKKRDLDQAITDLNLDGKSPELYFGSKAAVDRLGPLTAGRKFLVIISDGISNDQVAGASNVIAAARNAGVHICTIGFPSSVTATNVVQRLKPLAEGTGGYSVQAEGTESKLPSGAGDDLLKFMISGGRVEVNLAGLTAPVNLEFVVHTLLSKGSYNFAYKVDSLPSPPTPSPTPSPSASATPTPTPIPLSPLKQLQSWFAGNPMPTAGIAIVLLGILACAAVLFRRQMRKSARLVSEPPKNGVTPDPSPLAWLEILDGDQTRYPIGKSAVRIGRNADNDIVMKNDTISAHHAEILRRGSEFIIADLGSSNQVIVGGKRVESASLHDGDVIELGEVRFRFLQTPAVAVQI